MNAVYNTIPMVYVISLVGAIPVQDQAYIEDGDFNVEHHDDNDDKNVLKAAQIAEYDLAKSDGENTMIIIEDVVFLFAQHRNKKICTCTLFSY